MEVDSFDHLMERDSFGPEFGGSWKMQIDVSSSQEFVGKRKQCFWD